MASRYLDWFHQAQQDLEAAKAMVSDEIYNWACFLCQQSAEKAVKALFEKLGANAWGHDVTGLLQALPKNIEVDASVIDMAKELDQFYIPSRYPNAHASGAPFQFYTKPQAERGTQYAEQILEFCQRFLV